MWRLSILVLFGGCGQHISLDASNTHRANPQVDVEDGDTIPVTQPTVYICGVDAAPPVWLGAANVDAISAAQEGTVVTIVNKYGCERVRLMDTGSTLELALEPIYLGEVGPAPRAAMELLWTGTRWIQIDD